MQMHPFVFTVPRALLFARERVARPLLDSAGGERRRVLSMSLFLFANDRLYTTQAIECVVRSLLRSLHAHRWLPTALCTFPDGTPRTKAAPSPDGKRIVLFDIDNCLVSHAHARPASTLRRGPCESSRPCRAGGASFNATDCCAPAWPVLEGMRDRPAHGRQDPRLLQEARSLG